MAEMTEKKYNKLKEELMETKLSLEEAMAAQIRARDEGDLKENEEYHTARKRTEEISKKKIKLETDIAEAEIVPEDKSPRIAIGSTILVTKLDKEGNPVGEEREFTLETEGDTVIAKVLSVNSSLGKKVINGTNGIYKVPENGGISYLVKKKLD